MCSAAEAACYQTHDMQACAIAQAQYQANTDNMIDQMNSAAQTRALMRLNNPAF
jgi:hypothetical protein